MEAPEEDIKHRAAAAVSKYETMAARIEKERRDGAVFWSANHHHRGTLCTAAVVTLFVRLWQTVLRIHNRV